MWFVETPGLKKKKGKKKKKDPFMRLGFTVLTVPPINHLPVWAWKSTGHGLIAPAPGCQATNTRGKSENC